VNDAFTKYTERYPREWQFRLDTIATVRRSRNDRTRQARDSEGEQLLARLTKTEQMVLLDEKGTQLSSPELAQRLAGWQRDSRDLSFVIGGPDGVSNACRQRAGFVWSLSRLTLPHGLARVLFAEQLYRAWSLQSGHPYHRT
jgi:23S rRNA (pseudouridine1915-N3)-methyltransferase